MNRVIHIDPVTNRQAVNLKLLDPPTDNIILSVGDSLHNLRSALDILATDAVRANEGNTKDVYFPFAGFKEGLEQRIKKTNFDRAGEEAVELLKSLRPYKGGNAMLRALHDINIHDKHVGLIPIAPQLQFDKLTVANHKFINCSFIGPGTFIRADRNMPILMAGGRISFHIEHSKFPVGGDVIEALEHLAKLVDAIVESFSALFRSGSNPA